jgi:hypothetical protein
MSATRPPLAALAAIVLAASGLAAAGAAAAPAPAERSASVSPAAGGGRHQTFRVTVTALHTTYGGTFVLKTQGPRRACATRRLERMSDDAVYAGQRLSFVVTAPPSGWCRGRQTATLLLHDVEDVSSPYDTCDTFESGSSQCEAEYAPIVLLERRFGLLVR